MALAVIEAWCGGFFGFLFVCLSFYIRLLHFGLFFVQKKVLIAKNLELKVAVLSFYCGCTRVSGTGVMLKKKPLQRLICSQQDTFCCLLLAFVCCSLVVTFCFVTFYSCFVFWVLFIVVFYCSSVSL